MSFLFSPPSGDKHCQEEGLEFAPRFDDNGLIATIASDATSGEVLMFAYMNETALRLTLQTGIAHYWSRSRQQLWKKGETSGNMQHIVEMRVDCDQDALWLRVQVAGDGVSCHTGRGSCFYRHVRLDKERIVLSMEAD